MPYCETCGAKTEKTAIDGYDKMTGDRLTRDVCSANPCHSGCNYAPMPFRLSFILTGQKYKCTRCGNEVFLVD